MCKRNFKTVLKTNLCKSMHRDDREHRIVQPTEILIYQRVKRISTHHADTSIASFNQETFSSILYMETRGFSETSVKIYHPARCLILENIRKYMSGRLCSSTVESSSIFQTSSLFLIQLLALTILMAHKIPQLQANERDTTESWSMQIAVFWGMPPSSMSEELFLYSKIGVSNFCEKMASLYQVTRRHVLQNIELNLSNYRREDSAIRHKLCSFALV